MKHCIKYMEFPLGRDLAKVSKEFFGALTFELRELDIDRHYAVLIAIENMKESATQQAIADAMRIDKVYMVKVIDYFICKGYVKRTRNKDDRREYLLQLTAKGEKAMPVIHNAIINLNRKMSKGLEKKEIEKFYDILNKMYGNLQELPSEKVIVRYRKARTPELKK